MVSAAVWVVIPNITISSLTLNVAVESDGLISIIAVFVEIAGDCHKVDGDFIVIGTMKYNVIQASR